MRPKMIIFLVVIASMIGVIALNAQTATPDPESTPELEPDPQFEITLSGFSCELVNINTLPTDADSTAEFDNDFDDLATEEPAEPADEEVSPEEPAEATDEPNLLADLPVITLGNTCDALIPLLRVPSNGTLWIAISSPDETAFLRFERVEGDPAPPTLDGRGRFIGCNSRTQGEQLCRVTTVFGDETYLIEIPYIVGSAFVAPQPTAAPAQPVQTQQPQQPAQPPAAPPPTVQPPQETPEVLPRDS